jgi:hypothetical protein
VLSVVSDLQPALTLLVIMGRSLPPHHHLRHYLFQGVLRLVTSRGGLAGWGGGVELAHVTWSPELSAGVTARSARAKTRLGPLEQALRARRDSTSLDLADKTRRIMDGGLASAENAPGNGWR